MWSIFVHGSSSPLRDGGRATDIAGTDERDMHLRAHSGHLTFVCDPSGWKAVLKYGVWRTKRRKHSSATGERRILSKYIESLWAFRTHVGVRLEFSRAPCIDRASTSIVCESDFPEIESARHIGGIYSLAKDMNSRRMSRSVFRRPYRLLVIISDSALRTPRHIMHQCWALTMTPAPKGSRVS